MSFQEKYNHYKEKQEAKKFFRSNNDQFLNSSQWIKTIGVGLIAAIVSGVVLGIVVYTLNVTSSLLYILCGLAVAQAIVMIGGVHSKQVAIVSVIFTLLSYIIAEITWMYLPLHDLGITLTMISPLDFIIAGIKGLFVEDLFTTLCVIIGMIIAYQQAQ
jgi:hypothetical protein